MRGRLNIIGGIHLAPIGPVLVAIRESNRFRSLLASVLICAAALAGLDIAHRYAEMEGQDLPFWFSLSEEGSFSEWFEYALTTAAAGALLFAWLRRRAPILGVAAFFYCWLTLDNALGLHEADGRLLAPLFAFTGEAGPDLAAVGEVAVFGVAGLAFAAAMLAALTARFPRANSAGLTVVAAAALAAPFGIGVDLAHELLPPASVILAEAVGFIEDFGELLALTLGSVAALSFDAWDAGREEAASGPAQRKPLTDAVAVDIAPRPEGIAAMRVSAARGPPSEAFSTDGC